MLATLASTVIVLALITGDVLRGHREALAELAERHLPDADFLFLDTEYHFPETLEVAEEVEQRYPNHELVRATAVLSREQQDETYGPNLYRSHPQACCRMRKVEPLAVHMSPYVGWITGLRRADGPTRAEAPALWLSTLERPDLPLDLLQRALARRHPQAPLLLLREPARGVPLHRAVPASAALIAQIRARWRG
mgnify:CR=1 FL=1